MLSIFPTLLDYWLIAPLILRVIFGLTLINQGFRERTTRKVSALIKMIAGGLLVLGLFTQIAALVSVLLIIYAITKKLDQYQLLILELAVALALLLLGPGFLAIDWPL